MFEVKEKEFELFFTDKANNKFSAIYSDEMKRTSFMARLQNGHFKYREDLGNYNNLNHELENLQHYLKQKYEKEFVINKNGTINHTDCINHCLQYAFGEYLKTKFDIKYYPKLDKYQEKLICYLTHQTRKSYLNTQFNSILYELDDYGTIIIVDYKMRILPATARKMKSEFFGKRGWTLHTILPNWIKIISDNRGHYHNSELMAIIKVCKWIFLELRKAKTTVDSHHAVIAHAIKRYIRVGHSLTNGKYIEKALHNLSGINKKSKTILGISKWFEWTWSITDLELSINNTENRILTTSEKMETDNDLVSIDHEFPLKKKWALKENIKLGNKGGGKPGNLRAMDHYSPENMHVSLLELVEEGEFALEEIPTVKTIKGWIGRYSASFKKTVSERALVKSNKENKENISETNVEGNSTTKDEAKTFQRYLKSMPILFSEGENHIGQHNLGYCYQQGIGTTKDEDKVFQWYLKSAEGGNNSGQKGIGTTKDEEKAFQWYFKSAKGGNHMGQNNLGYCYQHEIGMTKDEEKVFQWYLKSAEGGNIYRQSNLGYCYRNRFRTTKDKEKAFHWCMKSAEGGNKYDPKNDDSTCGICWEEIVAVKFAKNIFKILVVNRIIQMSQLDENAKEWKIWRWIDYSKFKNIEYLAKGGFGSVWKAEWIDMPEELFGFYNSNQVALKKLKNSQQINKYVLPIFGITQDPKTKEYAIVLRYMKNRNLIDFLQQNKKLPWKEQGLKTIHSKGFIHCDLHPGNLMITEAHDSSKFIRLGDLGLCRPVNEISSSGTYGVLPYIAPEVMNKNQYTQASDIYSVGIIMWVISTGKIPFERELYDPELAEWIRDLNETLESSLMFLNADQEMQNVDSELKLLGLDYIL
ncbi:hypothetical protein Glove_24g7 [Diversispora epigaea]|uniref:Protein kinase domain-containing protein n=1 Tax=Diversispora epigaea TaxID=1348612 RepID=A0A397JLS8_9GLOM|nr:hypothetical protein Glove_24g7 [Diversispora epigaea]